MTDAEPLDLDAASCLAVELTEYGKAERIRGLWLSADRLDRAASTIPALIAEVRRLRVMIPCSRGICSSHHDHDGTCAEASGWDETNEKKTR